MDLAPLPARTGFSAELEQIFSRGVPIQNQFEFLKGVVQRMPVLFN